MAMKALSTRCQVPKRVTKFGLALEIMNLITMTTQSWKLFRRAILSRLFSIMHQRTKTISARWISIWSSDILYYDILQSLAQQGTYNPPAPNDRDSSRSRQSFPPISRTPCLCLCTSASNTRALQSCSSLLPSLHPIFLYTCSEQPFYSFLNMKSSIYTTEVKNQQYTSIIKTVSLCRWPILSS